MANTMTTPQLATRRDVRRESRKDSLGFRLVFAAAFAIFLVAALADRLVPLRWLIGAARDERYLDILSEAHRAAQTYTPFAFMG